MFVGEQRFAEKKVLDFMEFFKEEGAPEEKFGQMAQYVKGMKATLDANIPVADEDPDEEENRKFEINIPKDSDEESEEEEEEQQLEQKNTNKDEDEDEGEESEEESEYESSSEEESDGEEKPAILKGNIFGSGLSEIKSKEDSPNFGKSIATVTSLNGSPIQIKSHNISQNHSHSNLNNSQNHSQVSLMKNSGLSFFGREHDQEKSKDKNKEKIKEEEKKDNKAQVNKEEEEDESEYEEESEYEDEDEEEEEEEEHDREQNTKLFGNWQDKDQKKGHIAWKPLEISHMSNSNLSATKGLLKLNGSDTNLMVHDASYVTNNTRIIDKANKTSNNTMRSDAHNIFNKSKIADNTTMRLEYDDDDEANLKYRL